MLMAELGAVDGFSLEDNGDVLQRLDGVVEHVTGDGK